MLLFDKWLIIQSGYSRQTIANAVSIAEPQRVCGTIVSQLMARLKRPDQFYVAECFVPCRCRQLQTTEKAEVSRRVAVIIVDEGHYVSKWYVEL